jgi:hypothetical protein
MTAPEQAPAYGTTEDGWGEQCPNCHRTFPVLYGPHMTWVPCAPSPAPGREPTPEYAEPHPCGHAVRTRGCGGCDPGAVEFEIPDGADLSRGIEPYRVAPEYVDCPGWDQPHTSGLSICTSCTRQNADQEIKP